MIGRVGRDDFGVRLRSHLADAGVDCRAVLVDESIGSGMSAAILRDGGDYGPVIVSGSNLRLEPVAVAEQWKAVGGAKVLILQNEIPEPANLAAAGAANADGAFVIMNAAPARAMASALLDRIDCLVVNRIEADMLSGVPVRDPADAASALSKIGGRVKNVIVTLGGEGLVIKSDDTISPIAAKRVKVVSSHGAGDCFVGALAAKIASGSSLTEAAESPTPQPRDMSPPKGEAAPKNNCRDGGLAPCCRVRSTVLKWLVARALRRRQYPDAA